MPRHSVTCAVPHERREACIAGRAHDESIHAERSAELIDAVEVEVVAIASGAVVPPHHTERRAVEGDGGLVRASGGIGDAALVGAANAGYDTPPTVRRRIHGGAIEWTVARAGVEARTRVEPAVDPEERVVPDAPARRDAHEREERSAGSSRHVAIVPLASERGHLSARANLVTSAVEPDLAGRARSGYHGGSHMPHRVALPLFVGSLFAACASEDVRPPPMMGVDAGAWDGGARDASDGSARDASDGSARDAGEDGAVEPDAGPPTEMFVLLPESVGAPLTAANDAELTARLAESAPGQHIILTGSSYSAARTLGEGDVVVNLDLDAMPRIAGNYTLEGDEAIVYGLDFDGANVVIHGARDRVLRSRIHDLGSESLVSISLGEDAIVAYDEMYRWGGTGMCEARRGINIRSPRSDGMDGAWRPQVFRNYIHDQIGFNPESCATDGEVIAVGQTTASGRAQVRLEARIHHNYLVDVGGDNEGIGVKSSYGVIAFNHMVRARGLNNRFGGLNLYIGNRFESPTSGGPEVGRGGYCNVSLGEVIEGRMDVFDGDTLFTDTAPMTRLRSDSTEIVGTTYAVLYIGDCFDYGPYDAIQTLVRNTNAPPTLGPDQSGTIDEWDQPAIYDVPDAIRLTPADVGVEAGGGGIVVPLDDLTPYIEEVAARACAG